MELYVKGVVEAIYFQNDANYYKVILVSIDDTNLDYDDTTIVVTGIMGQIHEGTEYTFFGQLIEHARYGLQLQVSNYQQESLMGDKGLIRYLSSDKFTGIGEVLATRIVQQLGEQTINKIVEQHEDLRHITGLTKAKRDMLIEVVRKEQGENKTLLDLMQLGFSDKEAFKLFQVYKADAPAIVKDNPYIIIEMVDGIAFSKVDTIAIQLDIDANDIRRYRGALIYALKELSYKQGNTYFDAKSIILVAIKVLEKYQNVIIDEQHMTQTLGQLVQTGVIIEDDKKLSLPSLYYAEEGIAKHVKYLLSQDKRDIDVVELQGIIQAVEKKLNITYSKKQKESIQQAIVSPLSILTGGPGTGKTTVLKGIVQAYALLYDFQLSHVSEFDSPILLAAPTGRAAKRMKELIGLPAATLHRLLGIGITGDDVPTQNDMHTNKLEGTLLIVDEMSMVDTWLMNWVFKSLSHGMQVLLVGDSHQLPSVGPGQVLQDLLSSGKVPFTQLDTVYRQGQESTIIPLAHDIKNGIFSKDVTKSYADRLFIPAKTWQIQTIIQQLVARAVEKGYKMQDVQVLAPMYKGNAGIDVLNTAIQSQVNPPRQKKREITVFGKVFRVGDKVLQLVNAPENNVFNGDMGEIVAILDEKETVDKTQEMVVLFDDVEVKYKKQEFNQLTLAYCCSVHKAQGSEFPVVIIPMVHQYGRMLRRDLLYTALTRSKQSVVFCGEVSAIQKAIETVNSMRNTLLVQKIRQQCQTLLDVMPYAEEITTVNNTVSEANQTYDDNVGKQVNREEFILTMQNIFQIDGMIGMENTTPEQFMST